MTWRVDFLFDVSLPTFHRSNKSKKRRGFCSTQIGLFCGTEIFKTRIGFHVLCVCLFLVLLPARASAHAGHALVSVVSRFAVGNYWKKIWLYRHGLQLLNTSFSFRKFTSTTALNKLICTRTPLFERLRWGRVFLERTQFLNGIQFTRHFIECIVAETKQFVGSSVNMILRRQTCGQCSSMSAGSKRRALENSFTYSKFAICS